LVTSLLRKETLVRDISRGDMTTGTLEEHIGDVIKGVT